MWSLGKCGVSGTSVVSRTTVHVVVYEEYIYRHSAFVKRSMVMFQSGMHAPHTKFCRLPGRVEKDVRIY
jgi:hypothetical protein